MPNIVKAGAMCMCSFGAAPLPLTPIQQQVVSAGGAPALTFMDFPTGTFGACTSPKNPATKPFGSGPCAFAPMPPPLSAWAPGAPKVMLGQFAALTDSSKLSCMLSPTPYSISIMPGGAAPTVSA